MHLRERCFYSAVGLNKIQKKQIPESQIFTLVLQKTAK
jgi:hypothetical protein